MKHSYLDEFVFIHINKTGGSSIEKALNIPFEHKTALEKSAEIGQKNWNRKLTFTVVRNPWDKVVSHYHYRVKTNQTDLQDNPIEFKEWVKRAYGNQDAFYYDIPKMFMPQTNWISDKNGNFMIDEIIRFENLEREFNEVVKMIGKKVSLPHIKNSNRGNFREYYDEETIEIVQKWFESDIERFDYQF
ncbi:MAG: hypothetical protein COB22_06860 [Cycloclasticus sp.]|nr:MAG: hypothetical protein COB22_06860 [Cycloclasticus sp.]